MPPTQRRLHGTPGDGRVARAAYGPVEEPPGRPTPRRDAATDPGGDGPVTAPPFDGGTPDGGDR